MKQINTNQWFILKNIGKFNDTKFSCITSINQCDIKYDLLYDNFIVNSELHWFSYSWRRRQNENISYLGANKNIVIAFDEILDIPYFRKYEEKGRGETIEADIENNIKVKKAMIEKYASKLGSQLYKEQERISYILVERYCGYNNILDTLKEMHKEDDFSNINDLTGCIISAYK